MSNLRVYGLGVRLEAVYQPRGQHKAALALLRTLSQVPASAHAHAKGFPGAEGVCNRNPASLSLVAKKNQQSLASSTCA